MSKLYFITAFCVITITTGCNSVSPLQVSPELGQTLSGKSVTYAGYKSPTLMAHAVDNLAIAGAVFQRDTEAHAGATITARNNLVDPAARIAERLAKRVQEKYKMSQVVPVSMDVETDKVDQLARIYPQTDVLLLVRTTYWGFSYYPTDWTHYRPFYTANAQLINLKSNTILATSRCESFPNDSTNAPTYDQMLADNAAVLKKWIQEESEYCIDKFSADMFKH